MEVNIWNRKSMMKKEQNIWNSLGYKVIRFWNNDVMNNIDGVILAILHAMEE